MSHRFVRCPHCKLPHDAADAVCPTTGRRLAFEPTRSRMSEVPPPSRRPEPMGYEAKRREAAADVLIDTRNPLTELIGKNVGGRYLIRGILGEGGMGTVYDAEHVGLGRHVAIKVLAPAQAKKRVAVKRFQQEARAAGAIGHPNICEVYDLGQLDDGSPYLVMEKLVGSTLAERISREGGLPFDDVLDVMIQVVGGLVAAHDKGIVHRDIKPENVFLTRRTGVTVAKILDFGVSKMMPQAQGEEQLDLTRTGMVMGTPYYMSPEQARGERSLDGRVDVYACGVMMYEALVGKRPFLAPNYNALLLSIINTSPRPLREARPGTPPAIEAIVLRAMEKAREDRFASSSHLLRDLMAVAARGRAAPSASGRMPPPPTAEERLRAPVLGGRTRQEARRAPQERSKSAPLERSKSAQTDSPVRRDTEVMRPQSHASSRDARARQASRDAHAVRVHPAPPPPPRPEEFPSTEIPIHVSASDLDVPVVTDITQPGGSYDELPTEIFRPGSHGRAGSRPPSRPPRDGGRGAGARAPSASTSTRARTSPSHDEVPVHVDPFAHYDIAGEEWEDATVVRSPSAALDTRPSSFNPEETVAMSGEIDVEIDISDDTRGPSRRR